MPEIRNRDGLAADARNLDIAIVNPKKAGKETRYDVVSLDLTGANPVIQTRLGKKFLLTEAPIAPSRESIEAAWLRALAEEPDAFAYEVGDDTLVKWALGMPAEVNGVWHASLKEFIAAQESEPDFVTRASFDDEDDDTDISIDVAAGREVFRVSASLAGALPFLPTVAYEV